MLVRKCGLDAVKAVMPEEHMKLLTNIRKIKERKERRFAGDSEVETKSAHSKATSRLSHWNHTKIFSDFGDEDSEDDEYVGTKASSRFNSKFSTSRSKQTRRVAAVKSLPEDLFEELEDDPIDFLDQQKVRSALQSSGNHLKRKYASTDGDAETRSRAGSSSSHISSKSLQKRRKTSASGYAYTGNEYASKKARGDVKRKDKLEPYAYWPLDRKMMSRRPEHRAAARKGMSSVVKMTKQLQGKSVSSAPSLKGGLKFKRKQKKHSKSSA